MTIRGSGWIGAGVVLAASFGTWAGEPPANPPSAEPPPPAAAISAPASNGPQGAGGRYAPNGAQRPPHVLQRVLKLQGQTVRGTGGEKLGEIADLVVDVRSGEIPFVLVASAMGPESNYRLRLVPVTALTRLPQGGEFSVPFPAVRWRQLDSIDASELAAGALVAFETQRQEIGRALGLARSGAEPSRLFLATHLRGKALHSPTEIVGRIEGVVAAPDQATALALVKSSQADPRTYLVPMAKLHLPSFQADHFTTRLTRTELEAGAAAGIEVSALVDVRPELARILGTSGLSQSSMSGQTGYATATGAAAAGLGAPVPPVLGPPAGGRPSLAPTGRNGDEVRNEQIEAALARVRETLANDPSIPNSDIQVEVSEGKLVLRGRVASAEVGQRLEQLARGAAPAAEIVNQLAVGGR
jgi:sporulation protein YlmC with PRC-barrel domain